MAAPDSFAAAVGDSNVRQQFRPVAHTAVTFEDEFWAPRLEVNRERTIPHLYRALKNVGSIDAFRPDWQWPIEATRRLPWGGTPTMFWDSDVAKWIEAASYSLATHPDPQLEAQVDGVIALIAQAQQADGYLNTWFTSVDPENRWKNLRDWHELYCAGHLIEAAVAHFTATGKRSLLDILRRYADHIASTFGVEPGKQRGYDGHPEIELALVKLANVTGERRYLELSRYFVDERGQQPHFFDLQARARGEDPATLWARSYEYHQAHRPVRQQHEVVGHAVRAVYLYSAMTDLAAAYDDAELWQTCERLWQHLTTTRMYVTGGIGTSKQNEGFTADYDLPNESAYAETCASIGLIFWAQRMLQLDCNRRYADIMELGLYNSVLSGVSADGQAFFYDNPLASRGTHHRQPWFACPCCPPNLARLFASLGQYVYSQSATDIVVHLYAQGTGHFQIADQQLTLRQETCYPWDGTVTLRPELAQPMSFGLRLRIPAWCREAQLSVNGAEIILADTMEQGYVRIERIWQPGDTVVLNLPMGIERVYAHPDVVADVGQVALQRGPLVYCLEQVDQRVPLHRILVHDVSEFSLQPAMDLAEGVTAASGAALALDDAGWDGALYRREPPTVQPCPITAIPYYAWDHRDGGAMRVWLRAAHATDTPAEKG
ncbi:MAG TPA: beta-L-arabinofuranosidase domain-containing protein [Herpetosiphonaceae bacterium]|nr:beta-L-arabinofuranosidase domain-containing protein [Herpetosiphonaceae bacterium]